MRLDQVAASDDVDGVKIAATSEQDIERQMIEDGEDPTAQDGPAFSVLPLAALCARVGLSQAKFAAALGIPRATLRNWEQGQVHAFL